MKANNEILCDAEREIEPKYRHAFEQYFIGSLSVLVSTEIWQKAIASAKRLTPISEPKTAVRP